MKRIILVSLTLVLAQPVFAQGKKYVSSMEKTIVMMDSSRNAAALLSAANSFERIGNAESKEWLPPYYAAFCYAMMTFYENDNDKKDSYLDVAQKFIDKSDSLQPNNSEIYTMKGFIYAMRIGINPMIRGQKFGPLSGQMYEKAEQLNPNNPRPYYLQGQGILYTPEMWGGGKEKACPVIEQAIEKFKTFKPESTIAPHWGKERTEKLWESCK